MKYVLFLFTISVLSFSCKTSTKTEVSSNASVKNFGEEFKLKNVMAFDDVIKKLNTQKDIEVQVEGKVVGVCQAKGCWMNLVSPKNANSEKMFVKFKDYGFFMPLDLAGSTVVMNGKAYIEETSVDELKHYAEDAGKSAEEIAKIVKPTREIKFMASGVKIKG
jgi:hypothetical protein